MGASGPGPSPCHLICLLLPSDVCALTQVFANTGVDNLNPDRLNPNRAALAADITLLGNMAMVLC